MSRNFAMRAVACLPFFSFVPLFANNLFVVTNAGNGTVYAGTPLTQAGSFSASPNILGIFPKSAPNAVDTKYYIISRDPTNTIQILGSNFATAGSPLSIGQVATSAALTPDGKRLVMAAGNLRIFNTDNDEDVTPRQFLDIGVRPNDVAISQDSRIAGFVSNEAQRVTFVNLTTSTIQGIIPLPGIAAGQSGGAFIATGPNGMFYISAEDRVLEVDPNYRPVAANAPLDLSAVRRTFTFAGAKIGRLQFTPDGTRAIVLNTTPANSGNLYFLNLALNAPGGFSTLLTSSLNGNVIAKVFIGGNSVAYAISSRGSVAREKLYEMSIPPVPGPNENIGIPDFREAFFGSVGNLAIADQAVFSKEYPNPTRAIISAPLSQLSSAAAPTIYDMSISGSPSRTSEFRLPAEVAYLQYAGPAITSPPEPVGGSVFLNDRQSALNPGARSLPVAIKVLNTTGRPVFNNQVLFAPGQGSPAIEGSATVTTNSEGLAFVTIVAPSTPGNFSLSATPQNGSALSLQMSVVNPDSSGGSSGSTGGAQVVVLSGDGQIVREGNQSGEVVIQVLSAPGKPAGGVEVTWNVTEGGNRWFEGDITDSIEKRITKTDANGITRNKFFANVSVGFGSTFLLSRMNATCKVNNVELVQPLVAISHLAITQDGNLAALPSTRILAPEPLALRGRTGSTLTNALRVIVVAAALPQLGAPIPNVGFSVSTENQDPTKGPIVNCSPQLYGLTKETGEGACDVKFSGRSGPATAVVRVGHAEFNMNVFVDPGEANNLVILGGNNQAAEPNQAPPNQMIVQLDDGGGTFLPNVTIRWEITQGSAILANATTLTDSQGRSQNGIRFGALPGVVTVRATAVGGSSPNVVFNHRIVAALSAIAKVSGDTQTAFTGTNFAQPLIVGVTNTAGQGVPNQNVTFTIAAGPATFVPSGTSVTATTDNNGRAQAQVRAGAQAGSVVVNAAVAGLNQTVTFNLASQLPGPQVAPADFFNAASGEAGAISPGGLYVMTGAGLAGDIRGCIQGRTNPIGPWPTRVANIEVQFGAVLAPIIEVCNQNGVESIRMQVPFEVTPGLTNVTVRVGSTQSTVQNVRVVDLQPGIFEETDGLGRRYATARRPNGTFVTPENPARWGEIVRFFITGAGQTNPTAFTGVPGAANQRMQVQAIAGINDAGARGVDFLYAEGQIGTYEIQVEIPSGTPAGSRPVGILLQRPGTNDFVFPFNAPVIAIAQ